MIDQESRPPGQLRRQSRVAFLCQWFPPEPGVPEIYFGIARGLQDIGYNVYAITGVPNYPTGRVQPDYSPIRATHEVVRGIPAIRTPLYPSHNSSALGRILNYTSFAVASGLFGGRRLSTSDVNFVISSPATLDGTAAIFRILKGRPYVLSIQDLWPESIYATGFLECGPVRTLSERSIRAYCNATMRKAAAVLVITSSMKDAVVRRGVPEDKVHVLYNWVDEGTLKPGPQSPILKQQLGIPEPDLAFLYSGNVGSAQNLGIWIDAFGDAGLPPSAHLIIQGDGHLKHEYQRRAAGNTQIHFLPQQRDLSEAVRLMHGADAMVVSLADHALSAYTMPSKIPSALALGKAVVATVPGDAAEVLRESGAGIVSSPGSVTAVQSVVRQALDEGRQALQERGVLARRYYEATMSRAHGLNILESVMEVVLADRGGSPATTGARPDSCLD